MKKEDRIIRDEKIVDLRLQNYSMQEVSDELGIPFGTVYHVSHKYNLGGKRSNRKAAYNPKSIPEKKCESDVALTVHERLPSFEYVGGYTGTDGTADIRCLKCGTVITRSMISIRHSNIKCRECERIKSEKRKEQKRLDAIERAEEKKRQRFWSQEFDQISMKQCPECGALFVGSRKYCSNHCREQNKWHMKEGYRKLFPLEKVYERDGGICYLCGGMCSWSDYEIKDGVIIYGNNYPSRDHVVPKSKGGKNEWNNIRLAHRICNTLKGTR